MRRSLRLHDSPASSVIPLVDKATRPDDATLIACSLQVDAMPAHIEDWAVVRGTVPDHEGAKALDG